VFVVGCLGDWRPATAVLFDRESLSGNPSPSREKREVAPTIPSRSTAGGGLGTDFDLDGGIIKNKWPADIASTLNASFGSKQGIEDQHINGGASLFVPELKAYDMKQQHNPQETETVQLTTKNCSAVRGDTPLVKNEATTQHGNIAGSLTARHDSSLNYMSGVQQQLSVRRLTPVECERLQGFPDGYTDIKPGGRPTPDGPRYKALGNSMAVPVMRWIGERIKQVEEIR